MVLPRVLVYGTLVLLATLVLLDANVGRPLTDRETERVRSAADYLNAHGFRAEARMVYRIIGDGGFRTSSFFETLGGLAAARGSDFAYYAYTPVLSRKRIFVGNSFWDVGKAGRSSIIIHELAHIRRHTENRLRGFPRRRDEAFAYERQYMTHRALRLTEDGGDGMVYADMMVGVISYVLPVHREYAKRADISAALGITTREEETCSMTDLAIILVYFLFALLLLAGGDRLGSRVACKVFGRCEGAPLLHLGPWVLPLVLLIPGLVMLGFVGVCMNVHTRSAIEVLADNLEYLVLATFFLTGLVGGFFTHTRHGGL